MSVDLPVSGRGMSPVNERTSLLIVIVYQALDRVGETIRVFLKDGRRTKNTLKKSPDKWRKATIWPSVNEGLANC